MQSQMSSVDLLPQQRSTIVGPFSDENKIGELEMYPVQPLSNIISKQFVLKQLLLTFLYIDKPLNVTDHLKLLTNVLWDVRPRWYHLGVQLNVDQPTLEVS